jgi:hypothetical protein
MKRLVVLFVPSVLLLYVSQNCSKKSDPGPAAVATYPDIKKYFDAGYVASVGFQDKDTATAIADGKPALVIKDIIGKRHWYWAGPSGALSPMWSTSPLYHSESKADAKAKGYGYVLVPNTLNTVWQSNVFAAMPQPYDIYVVLRDFECVQYEAYFAPGIGIRNRGDHLGMGLDDQSGTTQQLDFTVTNPPTLVDFDKITIMRIRVDGANTMLWLNNVVVAPGAVDIGTGAIKVLGYGTPSHAAQHDFFSMWVKFGTISSADHATIYQTLSDFYKPGTYPDYPLATAIRAAWNNGSTAASKGWTATYTYQGANPQDTTKTTYQWGYYDQTTGDVGTASFLTGDNSTKKSLLRSDYPTIFATLNRMWVFVIVKVFDSKGNTWSHLVRSPMTFDNIP